MNLSLKCTVFILNSQIAREIVKVSGHVVPVLLPLLFSSSSSISYCSSSSCCIFDNVFVHIVYQMFSVGFIMLLVLRRRRCDGALMQRNLGGSRWRLRAGSGSF